MSKFLRIIVAASLIVGLAMVLNPFEAGSARTYLQVIFPENPAGTSTRFWRSGASSGSGMASTATVSDKDTTEEGGILYSRVFEITRKTEINPADLDVVQVPPDQIWFGGTYIIGGQVQDSLLLTWYGHRADGDSTTTAVAAQDTMVIDTVGVSDELDQIFFMQSFTPAFFYDQMSITLTHVRPVNGDSIFVDDCFLLARWNE